jgi:SpoVK/Ycf46/Vps4 family AAA+-type ATPase
VAPSGTGFRITTNSSEAEGLTCLDRLLAGPPGVGKTLTAESVADDLRVPLYIMSAGDLGTEPREIEVKLNFIMSNAAKWNAVLLLDEADVFLKARSVSDLERNKLVSIFLRMLEYCTGILFLTTNRIKNIDDAFHSRIHVTLNYPNLSQASRRRIWEAFLGKHSNISANEIDELSKLDLNGRVIKNIMKTALMVAQSEHSETGGDPARLDITHIRTVLAIEQS